jgi:hypothetical protein
MVYSNDALSGLYYTHSNGVGRDSAVGIATGRYGDRIPVGARISASVQTGSGANKPPVKWVRAIARGKAAGAWR